MSDPDATLVRPTSVPQLRGDVERLPVGDDVLLYREATGTLLQLDPTAALVAPLLDGVATVEGIAVALATALDAPVDVVGRDVLQFVQRLRQEGMLARP